MTAHYLFARLSRPHSFATSFITPLLITTALTTAFTQTVHAAEMSLGSALSAVDSTPQVERSASAAEQASWRKIESYAGFLPNVQAGASYLFERRYVYTDINFGGAPVSVPGIIPRANYTLSFNWPIFDGFANLNRLQAGRLADRAGQAELDWTKFQTDRQIVLAFYQALSWKELREVAEQNVSTLKEHLDDAQLLKRTGVSTNYDVLRVEVQMSEAQTELLNAQDEEVLSLKRLLETLGRSPEEATTLTGQLPVVELPEAATTGLDSSKRSDLIAQGYRVSASGEEANAASKHWFPKLGLFGQYQHYNNLGDKAFQTSGQFRDAYNLGVQVTWNLFDGLSANAKAHQSAEQKIQNEKTLEMARLRAANDLENWRRKFRYFSQVFKARSNDVNKATESVRLARVGRKAGVRTTSEQLDAELELFRARAGVVRSQVGMIEALVNLERSSGVRLYSFN